MEAIRQTVPERIEPKEETGAAETKASALEIDFNSILETFSGDLDWFKEIFELFVEKYPDYIKTIKTAISENDGKALERAAHSLKGSVSLFKISDIINSASKLELMGKEGKLEEAVQTLSKLEYLISEFIPAIKNILQKENSLVKT